MTEDKGMGSLAPPNPALVDFLLWDQSHRRLLNLVVEVLELGARSPLPSALIGRVGALARTGLISIGNGSTVGVREAVDSIASAANDLSVLLRLAALRLADRIDWMAQHEGEHCVTKDLALLYRQEARRQAVVATQIVDGMLTMPTNYIPQKTVDQGIDRVGLMAIRGLLQTEISKLDANEATIAVVGTMKAGKSTIICATVGSEIVPAREQPMTTFPTIITHVPDQGEPVLRFPLSAAFSDLAVAVRVALETDAERASELLATAPAGNALRSLATEITSGKFEIPESAEGLVNVRQLLERVNDLTRLARLLDVSEDCVAQALVYENLPRISIQFEHLVATPGIFSGALSLVDTPGPDEAGSSQALEDIAKRQLADASAIILVVNFGTIGNDADDKVKKLLTLLPPGAGDRLFIFVNKYDSAQERGDGLSDEDRRSAEEARISDMRALLARQVLQEVKGGDFATLRRRTFPTVASLALLANQARRAVRLNGKLSPEFAWVQNFAVEAFGKSWRRQPEKLNDIEALNDAIEDSWEASRFSAPLNDAINYSAENASRLAVMACLDKMREGMGRVYERLGIGRGALEKDTESVLAAIRDFGADLEAIQRIGAENTDLLENVGKDIAPKLNNYGKVIHDQILSIVDIYQEIGGLRNKKDKIKKKQEKALLEKRKHLSNILVGLRKLNTENLHVAGAGSAIDPFAPLLEKLPDVYVTLHPHNHHHCIQLEDKVEAKRKADAIYAIFHALLDGAFNDIVGTVDATFKQVIDSTQAQVEENFQETWRKAQDRINGLFGVSIEQPRLNIATPQGAALPRAIGAVSSRQQLVERDTITGFVQRRTAWLVSWATYERPDWGRDWKTYHYIDLDQVKTDIGVALKALNTNLEAATAESVLQLQEAVEDYAQTIKNRVEQVYRYLEEERGAREADAEAYRQLHDEIVTLAAQAEDLQKEAMMLRAEIAA